MCAASIRFGLRPERGPDRCSRVRIPGGAALHCWGGGAALTASSGMADSSRATKINHFYNGQNRLERLQKQPKARMTKTIRGTAKKRMCYSFGA